jgi:hypothetical protein
MLAILAAVDDPMALLKSLIALENWPAVVGLLMAVLGFWASWTAKEKKE